MYWLGTICDHDMRFSVLRYRDFEPQGRDDDFHSTLEPNPDLFSRIEMVNINILSCFLFSSRVCYLKQCRVYAVVEEQCLSDETLTICSKSDISHFFTSLRERSSMIHISSFSPLEARQLLCILPY
jgi:hypothetical protein